MKFVRFLSVLVMIALLHAAFSPTQSVQAQSETETKTIVEIAAGDGRFSTLVAALQAAGLVDTLNGPGPFTVFAPTDEAFAQLPDGALEALLANPDQLRSVLLYHAASGSLASGALAGQASLLTVNGQYAALTNTNGRLYINHARVTTADIVASNGVIHVIDQVILPAEQDVVGKLRQIGQFNTLLAAVEAAGLVETLQGAGFYTIFAPTDAAFAHLPDATLQALLADPEKLRSILLYHVANSPVFAGDVAAIPSTTTINGADVVFQTRNGALYANQAQVVASNYMASNGVIHVIDRVLLPPDKDIVDTAMSSGKFNTLVAAVQAAGLVDTLKGPGPFTIFAPTDAAFAKLPAGTVEALLADPETLRSILLYHAVSGKVYSRSVTDGLTVATVNGQNVTFKVVGDRLYINDARIFVTDLQATNGVIHVIDTVILPQ